MTFLLGEILNEQGKLNPVKPKKKLTCRCSETFSRLSLVTEYLIKTCDSRVF